ncbi:unnamed protein product [Gongylonema pulchrum]|uniref:Uncharacterized protein n=1 Tax=Gongylonema pulchrum TaxID=637853 RepID=A0A183EPJ2_9BILA|nr:unnamed protein product [Gongylonema pulchrum]
MEFEFSILIFNYFFQVTSKSVQELLNAFPIVDDSRTAKAVTIVIGGTICDLASLRLRNSRMVVDTSDYSAISSNTARGLLSNTKNDSEESLSDDEFDALTTHRSFIIDALHGEEDDSPMETQNMIDEWAEREARDLGLLSK